MDKEFLYTKDPLFFNRPRIITIKDENKGDFKCVRTFVTDGNEDMTYNHTRRLTPYEDNELSMVNCADLDDDIEVKITKSGKYLITFHVAPYFYPHIIGSKGATRREIENETRTHIKMPKTNEREEIIITGPTERGVVAARMRIKILLLKIRDNHEITHFVSIPVVAREIRGNFEIFKDRLLNGPPLRGVEDSIFQNPDKLHLTIVTLVLLDDDEIEEAVKALHRSVAELWQTLFSNITGLKIVMEGIEIMNDDPKDVDVLYGKVHLNVPKYNSNFQKFVNGIADSFAKIGMVKQQFENVKLHVTLMNSLFRQSSSREAKSRRESFDATFILEKFKTFYFGEVDLSNVQLCIRFTTGDDRYYKAETVVPLR